MKKCLLRILDMLGSDGYYARTDEEIQILEEYRETGYAKPKERTKSVYLITKKGHEYINRLYHGRDSEISREEFYNTLKKTYTNLTSPMKPTVRIPELRNRVVNDVKISNELFDKSLLFLHNEGEITLQTGLTASTAKGGIRDREKNYYYVIMDNEAQRL